MQTQPKAEYINIYVCVYVYVCAFRFIKTHVKGSFQTAKKSFSCHLTRYLSPIKFYTKTIRDFLPRRFNHH